MQEEVTQKTIALSMKTGKLTAQALQAALKKYLQHRVKGPKLHHGRQRISACFPASAASTLPRKRRVLLRSVNASGRHFPPLCWQATGRKCPAVSYTHLTLPTTPYV